MARLMALCCTALIAVCAAQGDPPTPTVDNALADVLINGMRETRAGMVRGKIAWTRTTMEDGFVQDRVVTTSGRYEITFDGERVAVVLEEEVVPYVYGSSTEVGAPKTHRMTECWDGRLFYGSPSTGTPVKKLAILTRPDFRLYHNLLSFLYRNPTGNASSVSAERFLPDPPEGATREVTLGSWAGQDAIEVSYRRGKDRTHAWYSIECGFHLLAEDWYEGGLHTYQYRADLQDIDGHWFPVSITMTSFSASGKPSLVNKFDIDRSRTCFRFDEPFPDDTFRITPDEGTEISDYRSGDKVKYILGLDAPTSAQLRALVLKAKSALEASKVRR